MEQRSEHIWSVPVRVEEIPDIGRRFELEPDPQTRSELGRLAGVDALERLHASFDVSRRGEGLHVTGTVSGRVRQTCVVSLDPMENEVEEMVDLVFMPQQTIAPAALVEVAEAHEPPEVLIAGMVDLGAVATEFFILGIDRYPRKPGAAFVQPSGEPTAKPFAGLADLLKNRGAKS
jgi:uncharacterized metal-binding protein YceD (DUF177 family)